MTTYIYNQAYRESVGYSAEPYAVSGFNPATDQLQFGPGFGPAARLVFVKDGPDLIVGLTSEYPPYTYSQYLFSGAFRLVGFNPALPGNHFLPSSISFADGTVFQPGTSGDDSLVGTIDGDHFDFSAGGNDTLVGHPSEIEGSYYTRSDVFYGGTALTANDSIVGGPGNDRLYLNPGVSGAPVELVAANFSGIENIIGLTTGGSGVLSLKLGVGVSDVARVEAESFSSTEHLAFDAGADYASTLTLLGGKGADTLQAGAGADTLTGGKGADSLGGAAGNDVLRGDSRYDYETEDYGADTLLGGAGDDSLTGDFGADSLLGDDGNDTLLGDLIEAFHGFYFQLPDGAANDTLLGGEGNDSLFGGIGEDSLDGDAGDDTIFGGLEADTLRGGSGNDVFVYTLLTGGAITARSESSPTTVDSIADFGNGADKFSLPGLVPGTTRYLVFNPAAVVFGYAGGDSGEQPGANKGDGFADVLWHYNAGQVRLELWVDANDDAQFNDGDLLVYLPGGPATLSAADFTTAFNALRGTGGNDTLAGGAEANYGKSLEGHDLLSGNGGNDTLDGGAGDDSLTGGALYDSLFGGQGNDTLDGGSEDDHLYADYDLYVYPEPARDSVTNTNKLTGGFGEDRLYGGAGRDTLLGGTGNVEDDHLDAMDYLEGYGGDDSLEGGGGGDNLKGGAGNDILRGGLGGDALYGGGGADSLAGEEGDDLLDGSRGNSDEGTLGSDTLRGGVGNDTLFASDGNSLLEGGEDNDELWGEGSNNSFGSNNNTLVGGAGSDTFYLLKTKGSTVTGDGGDAKATADTFILGSSADVEAQYSGYRYSFEAGATSLEAPNLITDFQQGTDLLVTGVTTGQSYSNDIPFVFAGKLEGFLPVIDASLQALDSRFLTVGYFQAGTGPEAYTGIFIDRDRNGIVDASDYLLKLSGTLALTKDDFSAGTFTLKTGDEGNNLDTDPALTVGADLAFGFGGNDNFQGLGGRDTLNGDAGNDTLVAGEDPFAGSQDVALFGGAGNDSLEGGDYADILVGGRGIDYLEGGDSSDRMYAAGAADSTTFDVIDNWYYTSAEDEGARNTLIGGTGGDTLYGSDAADLLVGGPDTFPGYVHDTDYLYGGLGNDTLVGGVEGDYLYAGAGSDSLLGGDGADLLAGNRNDQYEDPAEIGDDTLKGEAGNDSLVASGGNDSLEGGDGNDSLEGIYAGWSGYQVTEGPVSSTYLSGGAGNDVLKVGNLGNGGRDTLDGGDGDDRLVLTHAGTNSDSLYSRGADVTGGTGADTFEFHVLESSPLIDRDVLLDLALEEGDRIKLDVGYYGGKPLLWRGAAPAGFDATTLLAAPSVTLAAPSPADGSFHELWTFTKSESTYLYVDRNADGLVDPRDLLIEFRNGASLLPNAFVPGSFTIAVGTPLDDNNQTAAIDPPLGEGNDIVFALAGDDSLDGLGGNDTLNGDAGNDTLLGGEGQDALYGGNGNDSLLGGTGGPASLAGGAGSDTLSGGNADDTLEAEGRNDSAASASLATDDVDAHNWLVGGLGNDYLYGGHGQDTLEGGDDNDNLSGRAGSDTLLGGAGEDLLRGDDFGAFAEPLAADSMDGGPGDDALELSGADTLAGGLGNDVFDLSRDTGGGRAILSGGDGTTETGSDGADVYRVYTFSGGYYYSLAALQLSPVSNSVTITDFDPAHGDRLDTGLTDEVRSLGFPADAPYRWRGTIDLSGYSGSDYSLINAGFNPDLRFNEFWTFVSPSTLLPNGLDSPLHVVSWLFMDRDRDGVVEATDFLMRFENGVELTPDAFSAGTFATLYGTEEANLPLAGTTGDDLAFGFGGDDYLLGGDGNDLLNGDGGADTLDGDFGADALVGGSGADCLHGGNGRDTLIGSPGSDTLDGGNEADQLYAEGASSAVSRTNLYSANLFDLGAETNELNGGAGNDTLYGGRGSDSLQGGGDDDRLEASGPYYNAQAGADGNDLLNGGDGNDTLFPDGGSDTVDGGAGNDTVWFRPWAYLEDYLVTDFVVRATLADGDLAGSAAVEYALEPSSPGFAGSENPALPQSATYTLVGVEYLVGYYGNDSLVGNASDNRLEGGSGGFDTLRGGAGNDTLVGSYQGAVADYSDKVIGVYIDLSDAGYYSPAVAYLGAGPFQGGLAEDTLENITGLYGGSGADTLIGNAYDNLLRGGFGPDLLIGGAGNDTADYGDRSQPVSITLADGFLFTSAFVGGLLDDTLDGIENLTGGSGNDSLAGNSAANRLEGGAGNDTLKGDGGDSLVGGLGSDLFRVAFIDQGFVTVTDFGPGDRLQVVPFGANFLPLSGSPGEGSGLGLGKGAVSYFNYGSWLQVRVGLDDVPDADLDINLLGNFSNTTFRISSNAVVLNNSPTGEVLIAGDYTVGQTLTASNTLVDADGIPGSISYQWNANGFSIQGATGTTFKLTSAQINAEITVTASYTDGAGSKESVTSAGTLPVLPGNAPIAVMDAVAGTEDVPLVVAAATLLGNDTGGQGAPLAIASVGNVAGGTVTLNANGSITFTPEPNYFGEGAFSYTVTDGEQVSQAATVTVYLEPVNDPPTGAFTGGLPNGAEDQPFDVLGFELLYGFQDPDDQPLEVTGLAANHGTVVDNEDGTFTVTPVLNYHGDLVLSWKVDDGHGGSLSAQTTVLLVAQNDAPDGDFAGTLPGATEDTPFMVSLETLLAGFTDVDGDELVVVDASADYAAVELNEDGSVTVTPFGDYHGTLFLAWTLSDGNGGDVQTEGSLTVDPVNDAPDGAFSGTLPYGIEDQSFEVSAEELLVGFSDVDSVGLFITGLAADKGVVTDNADGTYTITPEADYFGDVALYWSVDDGDGGSVQAEGTVHVAPANDAPVAVDDALEVMQDGELTIYDDDLLGNDTDPDGDTLKISQVFNGTGGTVALNDDDTVTFTADTGFVGEATFTYTAKDDEFASEAATVTVVVLSSNTAPVAEDDAVAGIEDEALEIAPETLLDNDYDEQLDPLSIISVESGSGGTAELVEDENGQRVVFTPEPDFTGEAFFTYIVSDGQLESEQAGVVTVEVAPVNDAPTGQFDGSLEPGLEDEAFLVDAKLLVSGFEDADGDELSVVDLSSEHAEISDNGDGTYTVTPVENFFGTLVLTWSVSDGQDGLAAGEASVELDAVNDAPVVESPIEDVEVRGYTALDLAFDRTVFFDPDPEDELTLTLNDADFPAWLTYEESEGAYAFVAQPTNRDLVENGGTGAFEVVIEATDGVEGSEPAVETFLITVLPNSDVVGDEGDNDLYGTPEDDTLNGLEGSDTLEGGAGNDSLIGGAGNDTVVYAAALAAVTVDLSLAVPRANSTAAGDAAGIGVDKLSGVENVVGSEFGDALKGSTGRNVLAGGPGNDTLTGLDGADTLEGGAGNDTFVVRIGTGTSQLEDQILEAEDPVQVDTLELIKPTQGTLASSVSLSVGELVSIEHLSAANTGTLTLNLTGNASPNKLTGSDGANKLTGLLGNDTLIGALGNDTLDGGAGNDSLIAGDGNDSVVGGAGSDKYDGGAGTDIVSYAAAAKAVTVDLNPTTGKANSTAANDAAGIGIDSLKGIEGVVGSAFSDVLKGSTAANVITGGGGNDSLFAGVDAVRDTFVYTTLNDSKAGATLRDRISNFVTGKSATTTDVLNLKLLDPDSKTAGDQLFKFGGTKAAAGSVWFTTSGNDCLVQADLTGDPKADFEILLLGVKTIGAENLML